jgi:hypothetical protein
MHMLNPPRARLSNLLWGAAIAPAKLRGDTNCLAGDLQLCQTPPHDGLQPVVALNHRSFAVEDDGSCTDPATPGCLSSTIFDGNTLALANPQVKLFFTTYSPIPLAARPASFSLALRCPTRSPSCVAADGCSCPRVFLDCTDADFSPNATMQSASACDWCGCLVSTLLDCGPAKKITGFCCHQSGGFNSPSYDPLATIDSGLCMLNFPGSLHAAPLGYNANVTAFDGTRRYLGCAGSTSTNFSPSALVWDGCAAGTSTCRRPQSARGCMDASARRRRLSTTDYTVTFASNFSCAADADSGLVDEMVSCMDSNARSSFDATTTEGSCEYPTFGCTARHASNHDWHSAVTTLDAPCAFVAMRCTVTVPSMHRTVRSRVSK